MSITKNQTEESTTPVVIDQNNDERNLPQKSSDDDAILEIMKNTVIMKNASKLSELMMENVQKIKDNPNYIPQAEAINSNVKTMIDLAKTEIEMIKVSIYAKN
jgi:hypothetical protein